MNNRNASNHVVDHQTLFFLHTMSRRCKTRGHLASLSRTSLVPLELASLRLHSAVSHRLSNYGGTELLTDMSHEPSTKFSLSDKLKLKVPQG